MTKPKKIFLYLIAISVVVILFTSLVDPFEFSYWMHSKINKVLDKKTVTIQYENVELRLPGSFKAHPAPGGIKISPTAEFEPSIWVIKGVLARSENKSLLWGIENGRRFELVEKRRLILKNNVDAEYHLCRRKLSESCTLFRGYLYIQDQKLMIQMQIADDGNYTIDEFIESITIK